MALDVASDTSGDYRTTLTQLLRCQRSCKTTLSVKEAANYAEMLWAAGEGITFGTDEAVFIDIFTSFSPSQLRQIEQQYEILSSDDFPIDEDLEANVDVKLSDAESMGELLQMLGEKFLDTKSRLVKAIISETSFNLQKCLLMLLLDETEVVARMLDKAFKGFGTDEELVAYAIGSSSKDEIEEISSSYDELFGKSLAEVAASELDGIFEGDFQKAVSQYLTRDAVGFAPPKPDAALYDSSELGRLREEASDALDYIAMDDAKKIRKACKGFGTNE